MDLLEADLIAERDRAIPHLDHQGPVLSPVDLPDDPGLYALWPASKGAITDLNLRDVQDESPLAARPLYVGKSQGSILERLAAKHLVSGDTGHSTLRRTLAALLELKSQPRRTRIRRPSASQLRILTTNYALAPAADDRLTAWMAENLLLRAVASDWTPLRHLELAVGSILRPPLDQDRPPMWEPNPWRAQVKAARERLRTHAETVAGSQGR